MRTMIIVGLSAALVIALTVQVSKMYKAKGDLAGRAEHYLDFVDENSMDSVKNELAADAKKYEINLSPGRIIIVYRDTDQLTVAQKIVGNRLGTQFHNKYVAITASYDWPVLGWPVRQTLTASHIRQVAAPVLPPSKAAQEGLDSTP
jgi:hypothetical protein